MTTARWYWMLGALVAACADLPQDGAGKELPGRVLVRTDPASAAECPHGGSVVVTGTDGNADSILQDAEVREHTLVCQPTPVSPPPAVVVRTVAEPAGQHCRAGGTAVQSGVDHNGNGELDDAEVSHVDYLCRPALLTRLAPEPPGAHCIAGGLVLFSGQDGDGDGALDDTEIESTEFVCGDVLSRDVEIGPDTDAAALEHIRIITGKLTIFDAANQTISLPRLEHVGGTLEVRFNDSLTRLDLPRLEDVNGDLWLAGNPRLAVAEFPRLRRVDRLLLHRVDLRDLRGFPALTDIDDDFELHDARSLVSAELPRVSIGGDVSIRQNDELESLDLALADRSGSISIRSNPALEAVTLSSESRRETTAALGPITLTFNDKLAHVMISADSVSSIRVDDNPVITEIELDVARYENAVSIHRITTPFSLALSSSRTGTIEFASDFILTSPLESFRSAAPVTVDGLCVFDKTRLRRLDGLAIVRELRLSDNPLLTDVSTISLLDSLQVINNAALRRISFLELPAGNEIGSVVITDNPVLSATPSLTPVTRVNGFIDIARNPSLVSVFGPSLTRIERQTFIGDNPSLVELQFPELHRIGSVLGSSLHVVRNAALQTIAMPRLTHVARELSIRDNARLRHLDLAALIGDPSFVFLVSRNPRLPACDVLAIFAHVAGHCQQSGNDDTGPCLSP